MRRGHIHTFLYGVGREQRKQKWVPPIFVNGDPKFVPPQLQNYVVT